MAKIATISFRKRKHPSTTEPVRSWLKGLSDEDRRIIRLDIVTVEWGWPVGMPLCRTITGCRGLWEMRSSVPDRRIARIFFCTQRGRLVLLHGILKKTEKTPESDLDLAMKRKKQDGTERCFAFFPRKHQNRLNFASEIAQIQPHRHASSRFKKCTGRSVSVTTRTDITTGEKRA